MKTHEFAAISIVLLLVVWWKLDVKERMCITDWLTRKSARPVTWYMIS